MNRARWVCLLVLAAAVRLPTLATNPAPRGDVAEDATVAAGLAAGEGFHMGWERGWDFRDRPDDGRFGEFSDHRPPLVAILGAGLAPLAGNPYRAMQWVSLLAGLGVVAAVGALFSRRSGPGAGLDAAFLAALCFPLADYAGNGSLYSLQALVFCLWPLAFRSWRTAGDGFRVGLLLGLAWLLNYQNVVLAGGLVITTVLAARAAEDASARRGVWRTAVTAAATALLVALPWLLRNQGLFGTPLYNTNLVYLADKMGLPFGVGWSEAGGHILFDVPTPEAGALFFAVGRWTILHSLQLGSFLLLTCGALIVPAAREAGHLWSERRSGRMEGLAVLGLLACYLPICVAWPVVKFRYVIPLLPLVCGMGMTAVRRHGGVHGWRWIAGAVFLAALEWARRSGGVDALAPFLVVFAVGSLPVLRRTNDDPEWRPSGTVRTLVAVSFLAAQGVLLWQRPSRTIYELEPFGETRAEAELEELERDVLPQLAKLPPGPLLAPIQGGVELSLLTDRPVVVHPPRLNMWKQEGWRLRDRHGAVALLLTLRSEADLPGRLLTFGWDPDSPPGDQTPWRIVWRGERYALAAP